VTHSQIIDERLTRQRLTGSRMSSAREVVAHFGAMQSQDFQAALWAVALRIDDAGSGARRVEQAIAERAIVRTWPMRGTLHFVPAEDVRWMLELLGPRALASSASLRRRLEIDGPVLSRSRKLVTDALAGGHALTRGAIYRLLEGAGIQTGGGRGLHILFHLAHDGLLCLGARAGKQHTVVLLDEWTPASRAHRPSREEALATLARRYLGAHGPATAKDFAWWTGMRLAEAREAIALVRSELGRVTAEGVELWSRDGAERARGDGGAAASGPVAAASEPRAFLLPNYDEYVVGYTDRSLIAVETHRAKLDGRGNILFMNTVVLDGRIVGTWRKTPRRDGIDISTSLFATLDGAARREIDRAAERYLAFASS